jgi:hypothetical protein
MRRALPLLAVSLWNCPCDDPNLNQAVCAFVVNPHDRRPDDPANADNRELLFGEVKKGSSRSRTLTIDNTASNVPLTGLTLTFSPVNADSFAVEGAVPQVAANTSATIPIVFSPVPISGEIGNTLTITHPKVDNAACPTFTVTLRGRALPPDPVDGGLPDGAPRPDAGPPLVDGGRDAGHILPLPDGGPPLTDAGHFEARGGLQVPRSQAAAALLPDGRVLVVGGFDEAGQVTATVEFMDPHTGLSVWGPPLATARARHTATALPDGRVVVVGGVSSGAPELAQPLPSVEVFHPLTASWAQHAVASPRADHLAFAAGDHVLVMYGVTNGGPGTPFTPAPGGLLVDGSGGTTEVGGQPDALLGRAGACGVDMGDGTFLFLGGVAVGGDVLDHVVRYQAGAVATLGAHLLAPRAHAAAGRFRDGPVVVTGGVDAQGARADAEVLEVGPESSLWAFTTLPSPVVPRGWATALRVADDVIAVAGGAPVPPAGGNALGLADAELLVHVAGAGVLVAAPAAQLSVPRVHPAPVAYDGGYLLLGGSATVPRRSSLPDVDRFLPARHAFQAVGLVGPHGAPAAAAGNRLLVAGGTDLSTGRVTSRTRVLDLLGGGFSEGPPLLVARADATATLLLDASLLVAGGRGPAGDGLSHAERLHADLSGSNATGPMTTPRRRHTATLLPDGRVLLCGGLGATADALDTCELFRPSSRTFIAVTGHMVRGRYDHTATLLPDGRVLLTGGNDPALGLFRGDLFDPVTDTLRPTTGFPNLARRGHVAALVGAGSVLLAGGETYLGARVPTDTAELFDVTSQAYLEVPPLDSPRLSPAGLLFAGGVVLVTGGSHVLTNQPDTPTQALRRTELYDPLVLPLGGFRRVDLPLTVGRAQPVGVDALGLPVVVGGEGRHGLVGSGVEARVPLTTVDVWVP